MTPTAGEGGKCVDNENSEGDGQSDFLARVKRTIFVDELPPSVTEEVLKSAFQQFGIVLSVHICKDILEPHKSAGCAFVEVASSDLAHKLIKDLKENLLIIGMGPRPANASIASPDMFDGQEFPHPSATRVDSRSRSNVEGSRAAPEKPLKLVILHETGLPTDTRLAALATGTSSHDLVKEASEEEYQELTDLKLMSAQHAAERVALDEVVSKQVHALGRRTRQRVSEEVARHDALAQATGPSGSLTRLRRYYRGAEGDMPNGDAA